MVKKQPKLKQYLAKFTEQNGTQKNVLILSQSIARARKTFAQWHPDKALLSISLAK